MSLDGPLRSLLFAPGDRPELLGKLGSSSADVVVADWEDGVAGTGKERARLLTVEHRAAAPTGPTFLIRVNPPASPWFDGDLSSLPPVDGIVVPKIVSGQQVAYVRHALAANGHADLAVVVGLETVAAVLDARDIFAGGPDAAYFGAEDFVADLGGVRSDTNLEVLYARSHVALAARAAGVPVFDQIVAGVRDLDRFGREATEARSLGYCGKLCIHPGQVVVANESFSPSSAEVERARAVLDAAAAALSHGRGVAVFDGVMIDEPLVRQARNVLLASKESR